MYYAITKEGKKVSSLLADKNNNYFCPGCRGEVILKRGKVNVEHFAHKNLDNCDIFPSEMSEWHRKWQEKFPLENREVIIRHKFIYNDAFLNQYNLKSDYEYIHRADVCIGNYVLEFQHSSISKEEFMKRNYFYAQAGYKVVWIFDYRDEYASGKMECYDEWSKNGDSGGKWKWGNAHKFMSAVSPQRNKRIKIIFQLSDENDGVGYLELVSWAIEDYTGLSDYKRFFTSYSVTNFEELYHKILKDEL